MAKVIKEKNFDGRCTICGTYFEYLYEDLVPEENSSGLNRFSYVKCPKCGHMVTNIWHNGTVKK